MRYFLDDDTVWLVESNQLTQDEKDSLIAEAQAALDAIEEGQDRAEAQAELDAANAIIACSPSGAFQLTSEQIGRHKSGLYEWVDGEQVLIQRTFDQELDELNEDYQNKLSPLVIEANLAVARNTDNQTSKLAAAQAKIADLDAWYLSEQDSLLIKYFS